MRFQTIAWSYVDAKLRKNHTQTHYLQTRFEKEAITLCGKTVPLDVQVTNTGIGFCRKCDSAYHNLRKKEEIKSKKYLNTLQKTE